MQDLRLMKDTDEFKAMQVANWHRMWQYMVKKWGYQL